MGNVLGGCENGLVIEEDLEKDQNALPTKSNNFFTNVSTSLTTYPHHLQFQTTSQIMS